MGRVFIRNYSLFTPCSCKGNVTFAPIESTGVQTKPLPIPLTPMGVETKPLPIPLTSTPKSIEVIYLIAVNYYSTQAIAHLLQSIETQKTVPYQVIIVNNSPEDRSIQELHRESIVILEAGKNLGFGAGCNLGLNWVYQRDPQAIAWLINPDTELLPGFLETAVELLTAHPELSMLGTIIYEPTGKIWFAGGKFVPQTGAIQETTLLTEYPNMGYVNCDWVSGCSLGIALSNFTECPAFDEDYFLYYEDFDFCRRYAAVGHRIGVSDRLGIIHYPSSIADRNLRVKFKHSTYSYLVTMEKYSPKIVLFFRLLRTIAYAIVLLGMKRQVAIGKLEGVGNYLRRSVRSWLEVLDRMLNLK